MQGQGGSLVRYAVSLAGVVFVALLCLPVGVAATMPVKSQASTQRTQVIQPAHTVSTSAPNAHITLPFIDKKTYHLDALELLSLTTQGSTPEEQVCLDSICQASPGSGFDYSIGLRYTRSPLPSSDPAPPEPPPALSPRFRALYEKSGYVGLVDVGMLMTMKQLPASFTRWTADRYTEKTPLRQWQKHVSTLPVIDKDSPTVNISHAYSGSGYYTLCRNTPGFSDQEVSHMLECFLYSAVMSTFWEYVPEAFMEVPSIQDLIVTPVGGAILGELFYQLQRRIIANDRQIFGSPVLGGVAIVLLNPLEELVQVMQGLVDPAGEAIDLRLQLAYGNLTPPSWHADTEPTREDATLFIQVAGRWPGKSPARNK